MGYQFYGWEQAKAVPVTDEYKGIQSPLDLYDALTDVWCKETCTPRMRDTWTSENPTWGQCTITAFLAQDIFGGEVYGIRRPEGNYHCYNEAQGCVFDLTSEQFGDEAKTFVYTDNPRQFREVQLGIPQKRDRYELLKALLKEKLSPAKVLRAEGTGQCAGAYYVRIQAMARQYHITLAEEFDEHDGADTRYIVLLQDAFPIATARFYELDATRVMIGRVVVLPECRGIGYGSRVVAEAEKWARELGYQKAMLQSRDEAVPFYEKLGYVPDETKVTHWGDFTCIDMEKGLKG